MSKADTGGPAFPRPASPAHQHGMHDPQKGMTLRDYFAAKAMQALIEKTEVLIRAVLEDGTHHGTPEELMAKHKAGICESAYAYADAMLKARDQ